MHAGNMGMEIDCDECVRRFNSKKRQPAVHSQSGSPAIQVELVEKKVHQGDQVDWRGGDQLVNNR